MAQALDISIFDIFKIGIGPSSSHTFGPMVAANIFLRDLNEKGCFAATERVRIDLYGSLALTGLGHGTDLAIMSGLEGNKPESVDSNSVLTIRDRVKQEKVLNLNDEKAIKFIYNDDCIFHFDEILSFHTNGIILHAYDASGKELFADEYYSVGGGFVTDKHGNPRSSVKKLLTPIKHNFSTAYELFNICTEEKKSISQVVYENELSWRTPAEIDEELKLLWKVMQYSVNRGLNKEGVLDGKIRLPRHAGTILRQLKEDRERNLTDPLNILDWVMVYALAVAEENASYGRLVTAPTNGAAGVIPAVLYYYHNFVPGSNWDGIKRAILVAGIVGVLFKLRASLSGAAVGCQGEIGVACSMAAAGLTEAINGSLKQVENAAKIGIIHNLGLVCDPVYGLVQVPCIERNAINAVKAITASRLAMHSEGDNFVSLDQAIISMKEIGENLNTDYKETSQGGLALNCLRDLQANGNRKAETNQSQQKTHK